MAAIIMMQPVSNGSSACRQEPISMPFKQHAHSIIFYKMGILFCVIIFMAAAFYLRHFSEAKKIAANWQGFSKQQISEQITAENNHQWNAGFAVEASKQAVILTINIKIIAVDNINRSALDAQKTYWLAGIESHWNNQFLLRFADGSSIPIVVQPVFTVLDAHHEVIVREGEARPNQHNWYLNNSANLIAHEIGHMLGAFDEYTGGAISSATHQLDTESLMGENPKNGQLFPRNLSFVLDTVKRISQLSSLEIVLAAKQSTPIKPLNGVLDHE